jgi:polysaccharide pyruvyl transferase WcaK-like protein
MNVLIHGPFGCGSLADEALLAGLLARFAPSRHVPTVLTADVEKTRAIHGGVKTILYGSPKTLLSNKAVWAAFPTSNLFVLTSAGVINFSGEIPTRHWLGQLELVQKSKIKAAVLGLSGEPIPEPRESVRVQRLLHHFADTISVRDEESKRILSAYGLSGSRISNNGDPILGLSAPEKVKRDPQRIGLVLSTAFPSRTQFAFDPPEASPEHTARLRELCGALLATGAKLTLFHDDCESALKLARELSAGADPDRVKLVTPDTTMQNLMNAFSRCGAIFSQTWHGLMLGAICGTPGAIWAAERGARALAGSLGLEAGLIEDESQAAALAALERLRAGDETLRAGMLKRVSDLRRKEAQNMRSIDVLVPRREVYEKEKQLARDMAEEATEAPPRVKRKKSDYKPGYKPGFKAARKPSGKKNPRNSRPRN